MIAEQTTSTWVSTCDNSDTTSGWSCPPALVSVTLNDKASNNLDIGIDGSVTSYTVDVDPRTAGTQSYPMYIDGGTDASPIVVGGDSWYELRITGERSSACTF